MLLCWQYCQRQCCPHLDFSLFFSSNNPASQKWQLHNLTPHLTFYLLWFSLCSFNYSSEFRPPFCSFQTIFKNIVWGIWVLKCEYDYGRSQFYTFLTLEMKKSTVLAPGLLAVSLTHFPVLLSFCLISLCDMLQPFKKGITVTTFHYAFVHAVFLT
jgi:hypothetical protein